MSLPQCDKAGEAVEEPGFASTGVLRILVIGAKAAIVLFVFSALLRLLTGN
ncbi:MAG: hypothetical protein AAF299_01320 [Pseudomonadota bacterium]